MRRPVQIPVMEVVSKALSCATSIIVLGAIALGATQHAAADTAQLEIQKKNRSKFEYHDGSAEERRPYRRPDPDLDPTNLRVEEMRERINALEERIERLEYNISSNGKGR
jgi:TolA-binding protein